MEPPVELSAYKTPLWIGILVNGSLQGLVIGSIMKVYFCLMFKTVARRCFTMLITKGYQKSNPGVLWLQIVPFVEGYYFAP